MIAYAHSPEETKSLAIEFAKTLQPGKVIAFFGDLGTGKTTFIRYLTEALAGIDPSSVSSPTFQYLNVYSGRLPIYHFDLYRLKSAQDFVFLGFDEFLSQNGISCIEWAERIEGLLPQDAIRITITHEKEDVRKIDIQEGI